jgi:DNA anti-recombination protein RmuC
MTETDLERGRREGRIDSRLDAHDANFGRINGQIAKFVTAMGELGEEFRKLSSEFRTMREELALDRIRVKTAAETLAQETERRRREAETIRVDRAAALEAPVRTWNLRAHKAQVVSLIFTLASIGTAVYFSTH